MSLCILLHSNAHLSSVVGLGGNGVIGTSPVVGVKGSTGGRTGGTYHDPLPQAPHPNQPPHAGAATLKFVVAGSDMLPAGSLAVADHTYEPTATPYTVTVHVPEADMSPDHRKVPDALYKDSTAPASPVPLTTTVDDSSVVHIAGVMIVGRAGAVKSTINVCSCTGVTLPNASDA